MASPTVVKLVPMTILTVQVAVTPVVDAVKTLRRKFGLVSTPIATLKGSRNTRVSYSLISLLNSGEVKNEGVCCWQI